MGASTSSSPVSRRYNWIVHPLDIGRTPAIFLSLSDFKSVTSVGFLNQNYMGHDFWILCKTSKRACLASFCVLNKTCFSGFLRHSIDPLSSKLSLTEWNYCTRITCLSKSSLCLLIFDIFSKIVVSY